MNLKNLKSLFKNNGCKKIYFKRLSPNDNSKNQVYFGGNFEVLNIIPFSEIKTEEAGEWEKERFKAKIEFFWLDDEGAIYPAPQAQLILYPAYPEVRFSGFLKHCNYAPSELMRSRLDGRYLFFSVSDKAEVLGYVTSPESDISRETENLPKTNAHGVFGYFDLSDSENDKDKIVEEMRRIHSLGWIKSKRLDSNGNILPCESSNCGGYTLEAELGITPNGYSEPDYLGWEVKQFGVPNFNRINSSIITLMTPEPNDGLYQTKGADYFIRNYGYTDRVGRLDRMNFGGIHKAGKRHGLTNLELQLHGFDIESGKIRNSGGCIVLLDTRNEIAASWSFSSLLKHWNRKHNQACYIPSISEKRDNRYYHYGDKLIMGTGTDFQLFLAQMANGNIYYDPGIKMENISTSPKIKKRSQFRIKAQYLPLLYKMNEVVKLKIK